MLDNLDAVTSPVFWGLLLVMVLGAGIYGFGSNVADRIFGPNPAKVHEACIQQAHADRENCRNGGLGGSLLKTKGRIKMCQGIYEDDKKDCE